MEQEKDSIQQSGESDKEKLKDLLGMDPETSLYSVNFATDGNRYLNVDYQDTESATEE